MESRWASAIASTSVIVARRTSTFFNIHDASAHRHAKIKPRFDLTPHVRSKRLIVSGAWHEDQPLGFAERRDDSLRMLRRRGGVRVAMDEQDGNGNFCCRRNWARVVHL